MAKELSQKIKVRTLTGVVVSTKNKKTAVVKVDSIKTHPKYGKQYRMSRKYQVHDEKNECQVGEKVTIKACRPLSRHKRWRLAKSKVTE